MSRILILFMLLPTLVLAQTKRADPKVSTVEGPCDRGQMEGLLRALQGASPDQAPGFALGGILDSCAKALPKDLASDLETVPRVNPNDRATVVSAVLSENLKFSTAACPKAKGVFSAMGVVNPKDRAVVIYSGCKFNKLGLLTKEEFEAAAQNGHGFHLMAPFLFKWLIDNNMDIEVARAAMRALAGLKYDLAGVSKLVDLSAAVPAQPDLKGSRENQKKRDAPARTGREDAAKVLAASLVAQMEPTVEGALDKELVRKVIQRNDGQLRYCHESQSARSPGLAGKVVVKFTISSTGAVASSEVVQSVAGHAEFEACVAHRVRTWMFPKPTDGGLVVVTYPFFFEPLSKPADIPSAVVAGPRSDDEIVVFEKDFPMELAGAALTMSKAIRSGNEGEIAKFAANDTTGTALKEFWGELGEPAKLRFRAGKSDNGFTLSDAGDGNHVCWAKNEKGKLALGGCLFNDGM